MTLESKRWIAAAPVVNGSIVNDERDRLFERGIQISRRLTLRLPFADGVVVLCTQGSKSPEGHSHSLPQNLHSLDFAARGEKNVMVVAAAAGRVLRTPDPRLRPTTGPAR